MLGTRMNASLLIASGLACSCGSSPTTLHLLSSGDVARTTEKSPSPSDTWVAPRYQDTAWALTPSPLAVGGEGATWVRAQFDIGPDAAGWRSLTLDVAGARSWRAWVNGQRLGAGEMSGKQALAVGAGVLQPSGNLLALAATAAPGATLTPVLDGQVSADVPHVTLGPWLQRPRTDGASVLFETSTATAATVVVDGKRYDAGDGTHHDAEIAGLEPSHAYRYHVEIAGQTPGDDAELVTAPRPGEPVSFVLWGDHRTDGDDHRRGAAAVLAEAPDFVVDVGDLVDTSTEAEWHDFFAAEYSLLRRVPMIPVLGDHEAASGGTARFGELFPPSHSSNPGGAYSVDVGAVHVAVLNSNGDVRDQARWLHADLTAAEAHGATALFVATHHGMASSGTRYGHGINDDFRYNVGPVARAHHVVAMLAGHDHFYERGTLDGLHYVVSGGGGAPMNGDHKPIAGSEVLLERLHHCVIRVDGSTVRMRTLSPTGELLDEVTLR